ncbi:MAG: SDR family NAD(P)-dependent oxidoreductase [Novosphingobium sp.]
MLDFTDKVAIVTGAGRGLGRAHAMLLAARGCRVVVNDLAEPDGRGPAHDVVDEIRGVGGDAVVNEASVAQAPEAIVDAAVKAFGGLDILINNAGVFDPRPFGDFTPEEWPLQVQVHLLGGVRLCQAAWPLLKASARGKVINTISSGVYGNSLLTGYAAAKGGLLGFSRAMAHDGGPFGIDVNSVFPGASTRMQSSIDEAMQPFLKAHFQPERVAAFVAWLVHQDTRITGEMFEVGGGVAARVRFAHHGFVGAAAQTPEAWQDAAGMIFAESALYPIAGTLDMAMQQTRAVDPNFRVSLDDILEH